MLSNIIHEGNMCACFCVNALRLSLCHALLQFLIFMVLYTGDWQLSVVFSFGLLSYWLTHGQPPATSAPVRSCAFSTHWFFCCTSYFFSTDFFNEFAFQIFVSILLCDNSFFARSFLLFRHFVVVSLWLKCIELRQSS